jgi:hypothetical protein
LVRGRGRRSSRGGRSCGNLPMSRSLASGERRRKPGASQEK